MSDEQLIEFLQEHAEFFTTNDVAGTILRRVGWFLVKGLNALIDACKELYDYSFGLVDITSWTGLNGFIEDFDPLIKAFLFLSIMVLGFLILFGKHKQHSLMTSILVFAVVVTSSNYLCSQFNLWAVTFKDAVTAGGGEADGLELVRQNLFDLVYIEERIGLENLNSAEVPPQYPSLSKDQMHFIEIGEGLDYNTEDLSDSAKDILRKRMDFRFGLSRLVEVNNGVAWTDFGNDFYYRYTFHYGIYYLSAAALLILLIGLSYKNTRIVYELFVSRILVTVKSTNMASNKKTVKLLECIRDGYYALCFTAVTLRSYFLFMDYLNGKSISGLAKGILLVFIAFCAVDGANVMEKITGVDAGLSSSVSRMIALYHLAKGGVQNLQHARQTHLMKDQSKSLKELGGRDGLHNPEGKHGEHSNFQKMDQEMGRDGKKDSKKDGDSFRNQKDFQQDGDYFQNQKDSKRDAGQEQGSSGFRDARGGDAYPGEETEQMSLKEEQGQEKQSPGEISMEDISWSGREDGGPEGEDSMSRMDQELNDQSQWESSGIEREPFQENQSQRGTGLSFGDGEEKNMFQRWGEKTGKNNTGRNSGENPWEEHVSPQKRSIPDGATGRESSGKRAIDRFEHKAAANPGNRVQNISTERAGRTTYVGGDGGSEGLKGRKKQRENRGEKDQKTFHK